MTIQTYLVPTQGRQIDGAGNFFRYEAADPAAVNPAVRLRVDGNDLGSYLPGDSIELPYNASRWEVVPTDAPATVRVGLGRITTNRSSLVGNVTAVISTNKAPNNTPVASAVAVGVATGLLLAAKPTRQYLLIQNPSNKYGVWIVPGAGAAVLAPPSVRIPPGGNYEPENVPVTAFQAIAEGAGVSVSVWEG